MSGDPRLQRALSAKRESRGVEFKSVMDEGSPAAWPELIKDIVAMANSGGGVLVIGLTNVGEPSGEATSNVLGLDPAVLADRVGKYTGGRCPDLQIVPCTKAGSQLAAILIDAAPIPIVFERPGTYDVSKPGEKQRQLTAFGQGTLYFRRGARSQPATFDDVRLAIDRRLEMIRGQWLAGVRKVITARPGATVHVLPAGVVQSADPAAMPIRISTDPNAPAYQLLDPDKTHPFRQKEVIGEVNKRLKKGRRVNQYDLQAVRRAHKVDQRADFCYSPKFGSHQYSEAFVEWLVSECATSPTFLELVSRLANDVNVGRLS
jgi:EC042_2821-like Restriction Endonuclease-like domain/Schlafen, AlbA_2